MAASPRGAYSSLAPGARERAHGKPEAVPLPLDVSGGTHGPGSPDQCPVRFRGAHVLTQQLIHQPTRRLVEKDAACRAADAALFDSVSVGDVAKAKQICAECPVRDLCLTEYFLEPEVTVGGRTWAERVQMMSVGQTDDCVTAKIRMILSSPTGGVGYLTNTLSVRPRAAYTILDTYRTLEAAS